MLNLSSSVSILRIQTIPPNLLNILVGAHDLHNTADRGRTKTYAVEKIVVHRDRQPFWMGTVDIALIRVQGSINLKIHTPICLPESNFDVRRQRNIVLAGD